MCPWPRMSLPRMCPVDPTFGTTCFSMTGGGLQGPQPCPAGLVCAVPYMPGTAAPPGVKLLGPPSTAPPVFKECVPGDYCSLGAHDGPDLTCPEGTHCSAASSSMALTPLPCNNLGQCNSSSCPSASYCPAGTENEAPCQAGFYCETPVNKLPCGLSQWCPEGSISWQVCPSGSYCPTPGQRFTCPSGSYCPDGSIEPSSCSVLAICPEGSTKPGGNFLGPMLAIVAVIVIVAIFKLVNWYVEKRRMKRVEMESMIKYKAMDDMSSRDLDAPLLSGDENDISVNSGAQLFANVRQVIDIEFKSLGLTLEGGRSVLSGVDGAVYSGRLTAVMGPSGAGKTTFLTTLVGRAFYGKPSGSILINGREDSLTNYKKICGFVPQEVRGRNMYRHCCKIKTNIFRVFAASIRILCLGR